MSSHQSILELGNDECGTGGPVEVVLGHARLHRDRRGNISLLFLAMGLVFYVLLAMLWNTGRLTDAKIRAQTAADSAAYSSVAITSRTINAVTGANMLILRHSSSEVVAQTVILTWQVISAFIVAQLAQAIAASTVSFGAAVVAFISANALELSCWLIFTLTAVPPALEVLLPGPLGAKFKMINLASYQADLIEQTPGLVEQQRQMIADYYDCEIRLNGWSSPYFQPLSQLPCATGYGPQVGGGIQAPLRFSHGRWPLMSGFAPVVWRFFGAPWKLALKPHKILEGNGDNQWPGVSIADAAKPLTLIDYSTLKKLVPIMGVIARLTGQAAFADALKDAMKQISGVVDKGLLKSIKKLTYGYFGHLIWWTVAAVTVTGLNDPFGFIFPPHHVLASQRGPYEFGPNTYLGPFPVGGGPKPFTVVATAAVESESGHSIAPGLFGHPIAPDDRVIAYAQAETFNGNDDRLALDVSALARRLPWPLNQMSRFGIPSVYPWRVWSTWGWQWQPRLTRGDLVGEALREDARLRAIYDIEPAEVRRVQGIANH